MRSRSMARSASATSTSKLELARLGQPPHDLHRLLNHLAQAHPFLVQRHAPRLDLGEVEHIVDQVEQWRELR